jgi:Flp pilus assembly protein TadG
MRLISIKLYALRRMSCAGIAAVEFALVLPLLLALIFGVVEVTRYIITNQKVDNASSSIANVISDLNSSGTSLSESDYAQIEANALPKLLGNFGNDTARLSVVMVQRNQAGELINSTSYPQGLPVPDLNGIDVQGRETVIVSTITMRYQPLLPTNLLPGFDEIVSDNGDMTKISFYRTRSSLTDSLTYQYNLDTLYTEIPQGPPPPTSCIGCRCDGSCTGGGGTVCNWCGCPGFAACPPPRDPPSRSPG